MNGRQNPKIPGKSEKAELLSLLEQGYPPAVAEEFARVDPGTTALLIDLAENEVKALTFEVACGGLPEESLELALKENPVISWGLRAKQASQNLLKKAYDNINKSIASGNLTSSKWFISRHILTEKDKAIIELIKMRTHNERLQILSRIKEHSPSAYRVALDEMGLKNDTPLNLIQQLNEELRQEESRLAKKSDDSRQELRSAETGED